APILGCLQLPFALGVLNQTANDRIFRERLRVELRRTSAARLVIIHGNDQADACSSWAKRNEPEPAVAEAHDLDTGASHADSHCPLRVLPVVPDGDIHQGRTHGGGNVHGSPKNPAMAAAIHVMPRGHLGLEPLRVCAFETDYPVAFGRNPCNGCALPNFTTDF